VADGETLRLTVTALGAVIAGDVGAWITGRFNGKKTQAFITAAAEQAKVARKHEETLLTAAEDPSQRNPAVPQGFLSGV
jgi:hypothetical protein